MKKYGAKDNAVSGLDVAYGCEAHLFQHDHFKGKKAIYPPGKYNSNLLKKYGAGEDQVSSLTISCNKEAYMGCFADPDGNNRDLPKYFKGLGTVDCCEKCGNLGYKYCGSQYENQCFCGNSYGKHGKSKYCACRSQNYGGNVNCVYSTDKKYGRRPPSFMDVLV